MESSQEAAQGGEGTQAAALRRAAGTAPWALLAHGEHSWTCQSLDPTHFSSPRGKKSNESRAAHAQTQCSTGAGGPGGPSDHGVLGASRGREEKSAQEKPKPTNKSTLVELNKWGSFCFLHLPEILFLFTGISSEYGFGSFEYL